MRAGFVRTAASYNRSAEESEMQLLKNEKLMKRYKSLFDYNPHMISVLNEQGYITEVNQKLIDTIGYDATGMHFEDLLYDKKTSCAFDTFLQLKQGELIHESDVIKGKNGAPLHIHYKGIPVMVDDQCEGIFVVARDITNSKRMQMGIKKDLELASRIQRSLLCAPLNHESLRVSGSYQPASDIGGDMYVWYQIDDHRYGVLILDVMGHGISSALITMAMRSLLEPIIMRYRTPHAVMAQLNRYMYKLFTENTSTARFLTSIYVLINTRKQEMEYINAGHPPGLLLHEGESYSLDSGSPPLGLSETMTFSSVKIPYFNNSRLLLYTDGLLDYLDETSVKGAIGRMQAYFIQNDQSETEDYLNEVLQTRDFHFDHDDVTILKIDFL
ncbi:SpoIIE family protein phosphatase [Paenibacillus sp. YPG26]|uniref:SpoIIE family protein phosphatase n=1 Tax=Paenibacillus sp. YPG26 TaxID=2878915 RepID=UPI0020407EEC|nr:SpoIIE family protein phosphatase [Paenibacillus sp. YPG26]USB31746.1 SpoIIE family protein phosphatase [Paenibacillus sp. YPG26]